MDKRRGVLESLQQVRVNGISQNDCQGAVSLQIGGGNSLTVIVQAHNDLRQALTQILE